MAMIFGAWKILWTVFAVSQAFRIETSPESRTLAQIGDSVSLTCSSMDCEAPSFSWRTQIDSPLNAKVRTEGARSTLTMDPVGFENEHSYLCTATCGPQKQEKGVRVDIYSFPKDPEIQLSDLPEVGKPVTVRCVVPKVFPPDRLEVELLKGGSTLISQHFAEDEVKKALETKSLEASFTPTVEDTGKVLVCRAKLNIDESTDFEESSPKERETSRELQVYISPKNTAITVHPSASLQEGDSVTMTCSSEGLPAPEILWSKKLDNGNLQLLSRNASLTLIAMKKEDSGIYVCEGVNQRGRNRKEIELVVQEKAFTVDVSPGHQVVTQVGDSLVLTCSVAGCENPFFSWRTQRNNPLGGMVRSDRTESTVALSSVGFENEDHYVCTVTCRHRKVEREIHVKLYSLPQDPEIEMSDLLVSGHPTTVICKAPLVYPAARLEIEIYKGEALMMNKYFSGEMNMTSLENRSLEMTFTPSPEDTGKVLVCRAKLHIDGVESEPKQRQSARPLSVRVAPAGATVLVQPSSTLEEGSSVNMTCTAHGLPAPRILWSRQLSSGELQPLAENATLSLASAKLDDSGTYVCEGINEAGISRKEVELTIQVAPRDIQLTAFPSKNVKEGDMVIISCTCGNVPETWIILKKKTDTGDTVLKSVGGVYTIHKVQLEDAGVYECESKDKLRSLTLDVKGRDSDKDYFSPELLALCCASFLIMPAIGVIVCFARRANMRGSYSLVEAQKSKV
ncbi:vascular cell adhesion protein 1 [Octodon degus]|uniref:Vascular cell adhesion protein 1 n=1 Tax=Octodon degus TaxID=10160 RepID=A0A6P3VBT9_OCTDE|nr:vascular cell adhesion protein 1 [Octodon degus]